MKIFQSTKVIPLGSCAFRQNRATHSHCSKLHGYRLTAKIWFGCNHLDDKNWVMDFGSLKQLKEMLEKLFDHTTCIAKDDPELETFKYLNEKNIIDLRIFDNGVGIERFAETVFDISNNYTKDGSAKRCWVNKVEVWEHEGNSAICESSPNLDPKMSTLVKKDGEDGVIFENLEPLVVATQPEVSQISSDPTPAVQNCIPVPMSMPVTKGIRDAFAGTRWATTTKR